MASATERQSSSRRFLGELGLLSITALPAFRNNLLSQLTDSDLELLRPSLISVDLKLGAVLMDAMETFSHAYFVTAGIVSFIASASDGRKAEIGIYGYEGMGSSASVLGSDRCPYTHVVQGEGTALRIDVKSLSNAQENSAAINSLLLRYVHAFNVQTSYTALANGGYTIEQRLSRWLLMCQDRLQDVDIHLTHQFLATMLSVRRASVTDAIHVLEGLKIIKADRGQFKILDRQELQRNAGPSYGVPEREYRRLIGPPDFFETGRCTPSA